MLPLPNPNGRAPWREDIGSGLAGSKQTGCDLSDAANRVRGIFFATEVEILAERYYYSIASGSTGNCGLYVADGTAVLIDLGVSMRKITTALAACGLAPSDLAGVLLTHEHIDHVKGLPMVLKKTGLPVYASQGTAEALAEKDETTAGRLRTFAAGDSLDLGDVQVTSFATPHDAAESVGFVMEHAGGRFGFATDLGFVPGGVLDMLRGCDTVVLESNHDPHMLQAGPYPYPLKKRVAGPRGHLSNPDCAVCAAELVRSGARTLVLAHLSEQNNMPALALQQTRAALCEMPPCAVYAAPRDAMQQPVRLEEEAPCSLFG